MTSSNVPASSSVLRSALLRIEQLEWQLKQAAQQKHEPIAIIGMACRLPGSADSPAALFDLLLRGVDTARRIPEERWSDPALQKALPALQWAALLERVDRFDAAFFDISPREANMLDPQQRLLLEVVWEALENAGQSADRLAGSATGVFIGLCTSDYMQAVRSGETIDVHSLTGTIPSTAAGRISHTLGLRGPCMSIDTACSSSLVAVHLACQSLRLGESSLAIVGGVNLILAPDLMHMLAKSQALSPDGRCKTFDASANGYVRGEGCGVVVLKRLSDAQRDGDPICAMIRGSATNHNAHSSGLTVPSVLAQEELLRQALANSGMLPDDIDYIETHGTGTALGDPIEFEALRAVFGADKKEAAPCVLGALKTNIGHLEAAAGIAGLIKVVACLQKQAIPRSLHLRTLNPRISLQGTRFQLPSHTVPWPAGARLRRAGVSSFGLSGTNAHVVLEEAPAISRPPLPADEGELRSRVFTLSAKSPAALLKLCTAAAETLPDLGAPLADIAYTASCRRTHLSQRLAVVADSDGALTHALKAYAQGQAVAGVYQGQATSSTPQVVLVFSGQGAQWPGMGHGLRRHSSVFRQALEDCARHFEKLGGPALLSELDKPESMSALQRTEVAQPALFAIQIGLLAELRAFGIEPSWVIGHSVGEVAAAHAAGMLTLDAAIQIVLMRARAMQHLAGQGKMVAVELSAEEAEQALGSEKAQVSIAAENGPRSVVLAGETAALARVIAPLQEKGVACRELRVNYAFHSPQMAQAEQIFLRSLAPPVPQRGKVPMLSTVTAGEIQGPELTAEYWGRNICQPVRFAQAIQQVARVRGQLFVEVGPHPVLCADIAEQLAAIGDSGIAIPTLRRNKDERTQLLTALAMLHVRGVKVRWSADFASTSQVVPLPTYPWQRERFWIRSQKASSRLPGIASEYYDSVTKLVQSQQEPGAAEPTRSLYLTFAPFAEVVPDFSWLQVFSRPQEHPNLVRLMQQQQRELRQVLFRHIDFASCTRALDFGCGFATDLLHLAEQYPHLQLDGYTISSGQAEFGQRRLRDKGLTERVRVYCRDSAQAPFPGQYDLVFGFEVAHHIKDKGALFANIRSHLRSQGTLVLADFISHVSFEIEHDASSSFFLTVAQWTELLSSHQMQVQDVVDVSRPISNFLHDPHFDAHLSQMRQAGEDENVLVSFQSYDRLGKMLDRGLASYILLSAKKAEDISIDALREKNHAALTNLLPYTAPSSPAAAHGDLLYGVEWRPVAKPDFDAKGNAPWLLVARRPQAIRPLAERLAAQGIRCVCVQSGGTYKQLDKDQFQIDASASADYCRLLQDAFGHDRPCERVVYLSALEVPAQESATAAELGDVAATLCSDAVQLVQALIRHGFRSAPRLYLLTQGAQDVAGSGPVHLAQAPLWGLGKTIALEHPELRCTRLDLDVTTAIDTTSLVRNISASDREDQVALRGAERYVARLVLAPAELGKGMVRELSIRGDRSYLITGGLGGLGLELARWLVEEGAGAVILTSRSDPTAAALQVLQELNQHGARVQSLQADVCQPRQVARILQTIQHSGLPLAGIVHAAGILQDQTLLELSEASLRAVLAPKLMGAWNLHQQAPKDLDFFVLYSSAAALCGSPGQANYSAANAFLDALAQQRTHAGSPAMSIQWGTFSEVGMAAAQANRGKRMASQGMAGISPKEAHRVLGALLRSPRATVAVMRLNARQWIDAIPSAAGLPFFSDLAKHAGGGDRLSSAAAQLMASLRTAAEFDRLSLLLPYLKEQIGAVLQLEPSRLDIAAPFSSLGVDSLMSLEIRNRLEAGLGVRLSATVLFTYATLSALAGHILECLGLAAPVIAKLAAEPQPNAKPARSGSELDQLSDDDLAKMGEELLT